MVGSRIKPYLEFSREAVDGSASPQITFQFIGMVVVKSLGLVGNDD